jgi:hypothetical protein
MLRSTLGLEEYFLGKLAIKVFVGKLDDIK